MNYFQENVRGSWQEIRQTAIINDIYPDFKNLAWTDAYYFVLNFECDPLITEDNLRYKNIVLSSHLQTIHEQKLFDLFDRHRDNRFLLIIDQDFSTEDLPGISSIFPNVEVLPWITWHHQLNFAIGKVGINYKPNSAQKLISCLSGRQDIHKRIVTAFVLRNFQPQDTLCSWHNRSSFYHYWEDPNFHLPQRLKSLLVDTCLSESRFVHQFKSNPQEEPVLDWNDEPFVNCLINLCLESAFNDITVWNNQCFKMPGPMFTEKTWKPILAGQCFLPIGQGQSCAALAMHGISFDFIDDLSFDSMPDFDRLNAILDILDKLRVADREELTARCQTTSLKNLDVITSGDFSRSCSSYNNKKLALLSQWIDNG
jgi:hypothetical protein